MQREKLKQGFAELTPDCWEEISKAVTDGKPARTVMEDNYRKPAHKRMQAVLAAVAAVVCLLIVVKDVNTVKSMLYIDVNPSVCISVNDRGKVVSVDGVNEDGHTVADAALSEIGNSRDLGTAVKCIIAEIDREGYFSEGTVDVLVSLSYSEKEDKVSLDTACRKIEEYAGSNDMKCSLVVQSFVGDETVEKTAGEMGISAGKYEFLSGLAEEGRIERDKIGDFAEKSTREIDKATSEKPEPNNEPEEAEPADVQSEENTEAEFEDKTNNDKKPSANNSSKNKNNKASKEKKPKKKKEKKAKKNNGKSSGNKGNKGKNNKN